MLCSFVYGIVSSTKLYGKKILNTSHKNKQGVKNCFNGIFILVGELYGRKTVVNVANKTYYNMSDKQNIFEYYFPRCVSCK